MLDLIIWTLLHLVALGLMTLAAFGVGCLLLDRVNFHSAIERATFAVAAGMGAFGLTLFLLGLAGALRSEVVIAFTVAGDLCGAALLARNRESIKTALASLTLFKSVFILAGLFFWLFLLWPALFPPTDWDATSNHLLLAREYLSTHRITSHEGIPQPVLPALNHLLFAWAMAVKDDIAAQMIEQVLMMLVAAGIYSLGQRRDRRVWASAAAIFWLAHPMVLWLGQAGYVDVGMTAFAFLGALALRNFFETREKSWWFVAMSLMGAAAGVKITGMFFVAASAMMGLWALVKSRINWKELIAGGALVFSVAAPFYAFVAYHAGNPFWPATTWMSEGAWADAPIARFNDWISRVGVAKTPVNFLLLPYYLSFELERFLPEPRLSRLIAFWPLAWAVSFRDGEARRWSLWALSFTAFWFLTSQQTRLLLPALPFMTLALYESARYITEKFFRSAALRQTIWAGAAACALILTARAEFGVLAGNRRPPTDQAARDDFLTRFYGGYGGVRYINEHSTQGEAVYVIDGSWLNYYFKPRVIDSLGLLQRSDWPSFQWPDDRDWVKRLESRGVAWILVYHPNHPTWRRMKTDDPMWRPHWPPYRLVYEDRQVWVFRHW